MIGQVQSPSVIGGDKIIVDHRLLRLQRRVGRPHPRHPGRGLVLTDQIAGERAADRLLKLRRLFGADGQNGREPDLADHLQQRTVFIAHTRSLFKHGFFTSIKLFY